MTQGITFCHGTIIIPRFSNCKTYATINRGKFIQAQRRHFYEEFCESKINEVAANLSCLHAKTRIVLKDLTLFCNAIERAVDTCRAGGVDVRSMREETPQEIRWVLRIPRAAPQEQPALHPQPAASAPAS